MARRTTIDPAEVRDAVTEVRAWLLDDTAPAPPRNRLAAAVRATARALAAAAPGHSVEVRIPPFVAVQCVEGPRHTRGTPPNVVETDPRTWLLLATGLRDYADARDSGALHASGQRAPDIARWLPLVRVSPERNT
ncbi:sterol carrier family protein [Nocardia brevicatena]|uniref:sterol carrier family protein n=1 Tax=Nocardia brevicatena TaxID=37327 RepID=UPI000301B200|nr:sterol carrier family protein [Nocardia brevicatena]